MTQERHSGRASDEALLVVTDDPEAFGEFYDRYERAVFVFMARRTRNAETAADLTAETFAAALASRASFNLSSDAASDGAPAVAWLFGIARNVLAMSYRRNRVANEARSRLRMQQVPLPDQTVDALQELIDQEHGLEALMHLDELPSAHAAAIRAHILNDSSYTEIAASLGTSEATVRQHVSRGLAALRRLVSQP